MKTQITMLLVVGMVVAMAGTVQAAMIGVDIDDAISPITESGFLSLSATSTTGTIGGVDFEIRASTGNLEDRDRGATSDSPSDILRDGVFEGTWTGTLLLDVSGMAAGTYDVQSWHYDGDGTGSRPDIIFDMFFIQNAGETKVASGGWITDALEYQITTDGSDFSLEYRNTWSLGYDTKMNGFTFTPTIPEPATMSLLALGGLGILARRRRRA